MDTTFLLWIENNSYMMEIIVILRVESMAYIIGLDLGTTSVKAVLFQHNGKFVHAVEHEIETRYEQQEWAEQNVITIESLSRKSVRQLVVESQVKPDEILALAFCSAMHSLVAVDKDGQPLNQAVIWSDRRAHEQVHRLNDEQKQAIYERTGTPIHPMSPFSKLMWYKEHNQSLYEQHPYWMSIKEYIVLSWFGIRSIDYSMASATGLLNIENKAWDTEILETLQLNESQLSKIYPPQTKLPPIKSNVLSELGLTNSTVFVLGAADGQLSSLGIGAIGEGELAVSVGTSGAIREYKRHIQLSHDRSTFCYLFDEGYYIVGGPTNNGGVVLQWLKQTVAPEMPYEQFLALAEDIQIGADGLLFLPYLNGERAPLWNAMAKGSFFGLSINHERAHLVRAAIEGITYNLYDILHSINNNKTLDCIYINGGLSRSNLWLQLLADLFNTKVYISNTHHGAAWGACWIALMSLGLEHSYEQLKETVYYENPILPDAERHQVYVSHYKRYKQLQNAVKPLFE